MTSFDSRPDTEAHIARVQYFLQQIISELTVRAAQHDQTKLASPEKEAFDRMGERLAQVVYDSPEYHAALEELGPALAHHYAAYAHHPEHYANGMDGMTLIDLIEWFCDISAASERTKGGSVMASMVKNRTRFGIQAQLYGIFVNTARWMGLAGEAT